MSPLECKMSSLALEDELPLEDEFSSLRIKPPSPQDRSASLRDDKSPTLETRMPRLSISVPAAAPFIYINSWPGVGKHTIAKLVSSRLEHGRARVVHNHHHVDLAGAIFPRTSPEYQKLRYQLRTALFDALIRSRETFNHIYIFTDFQTDNELGASVAREFAAAARRRGSTFVPVVMGCQAAENERRIRSPERINAVLAGKGMLVDTAVLVALRDSGDLFRFDVPEQLQIDVSALEACEVADGIVRHLGEVTGGKW